MTCIMISHKLKEVIAIADTVTVLRDGQTICTLDAHKGEVTEYALIKHMVGREINNIYPTRQRNLFKTTAAAVEAARAAGVKVVAYDRMITDTAAIDYYVAFDSVAVGAQQAQYLVEHASGQGNPCTCTPARRRTTTPFSSSRARGASCNRRLRMARS